MNIYLVIAEIGVILMLLMKMFDEAWNEPYNCYKKGHVFCQIHNSLPEPPRLYCSVCGKVVDEQEMRNASSFI